MHREDGPQPEPSPRARAVSPRQVLFVVVAVLLIAFAVANFRRVQVSFLLFTAQARVVTVIVVAGALGFLAGWAVGRPSRRDRKRLREDPGRERD